MEDPILEVHLISAQKLKPPPTNMRRGTETYAVVWVDPATKLRTRIDRVGGENPTWNDKFLFRVAPQFLVSDTSAVTVEIYTLGYIRDYLVGSARLLLSSFLPNRGIGAATKCPSFTAAGIRRPSGKIDGVLNIAAMVTSSSDFAALKGESAIGYRNLTGQKATRYQRKENSRLRRCKTAAVITGGEEEELDDVSSENFSDGGDSSTSSSSAASTVLSEWNGFVEMATGKGKDIRRASFGGAFLCGLLPQK